MKQIILLLLCLNPLFAHGTRIDSAYQFIANLYTNYKEDDLSFTFNGPGADTIFTPELLKLIRLDQQLADGEAGYLDWDPLCDCQDIGGLKIKKIVIKGTIDSVYAEVILAFAIESRTIKLLLKKINGKWLINNIKEKSVSNLYEYLIKNLKTDTLKQFNTK